MNALRPYQAEDKQRIYDAWNAGAVNVLEVLPTGAGKTVVFSDIIHDHAGASVAIAHRQELVAQISVALARDEVRHRLITPKNVVKLCVNLHVEETGKSYYDPAAPCAVAGVDTLTRRKPDAWTQSVTLWVQDEAHHLLRGNKWGSATELFPNARGLGVTATPLRADGKGLGRHADGLFDTMVVGLGMRDLINAGYLTDYRIFAPPSDLDLSTVNITKGGDYNKDGLKIAVRRSHVIGDVVKHYLRIAPGKLGVTFATDVETAKDIAAQFNAAGVPAECVSAETPDAQRVSVLRRFKRREILQVVNVDLFGEGFDLPAIEVISMARPTQSYALYVQQFGRTLRLLDGKDFGIIIDHVGNVVRHGLPDAPRVWTLDRAEKRRKGAALDTIPVRACPQCTAVYERIYKACPFCGFVPIPAERSRPEFVDGDLCELSAEALAEMRGEIDRVQIPIETYRNELLRKGAYPDHASAHVKKHAARQEAHTALREAVAWWAGYQRAAGRPDSESYRRFYFKFGIDVGTAQALPTAAATELAGRVAMELTTEAGL